MKMFGELRLMRALTDEQIAAMRDPRLAGTVKLPTIEDAVKAGGFLAGRPEDIIEQLKAVEKRYSGLDRVICATPLGTPLNVQLADLDRFAKEVVPAFRDTRPPPPRSRPRDQPRAPVRRRAGVASGSYQVDPRLVETLRRHPYMRSAAMNSRLPWR
jgi:hypothetical protein